MEWKVRIESYKSGKIYASLFPSFPCWRAGARYILKLNLTKEITLKIHYLEFPVESFYLGWHRCSLEICVYKNEL